MLQTVAELWATLNPRSLFKHASTFQSWTRVSLHQQPRAAVYPVSTNTNKHERPAVPKYFHSKLLCYQEYLQQSQKLSRNPRACWEIDLSQDSNVSVALSNLISGKLVSKRLRLPIASRKCLSWQSTLFLPAAELSLAADAWDNGTIASETFQKLKEKSRMKMPKATKVFSRDTQAYLYDHDRRRRIARKVAGMLAIRSIRMPISLLV